MKKCFFTIVMIITSVLFFSCEENLNPYGDFKEKYVLNFIIRGDTTFQTATLSKDYVVYNADPYSNTDDHSVKGAIVRIWQKDQVHFLRDTTIQRPGPTNYQTPYSVYYINNFQPEENSKIDIEALLPNGKRLTSSSTVPSKVNFNYTLTDTIIPMPGKKIVSTFWATDKQNEVTLPRLMILYYTYSTGVKKLNKFIIPLSYLNIDNNLVPNYPTPSLMQGYTVDLATVNKSMELLSAGDPNKSGYEILVAIIEVYSFDTNLSLYYNSTARSGDVYSIKLDETDYSNINGGFGIFGIYMKSQWAIRFSNDFIKSFGYTPAFNN
ncbi:MAG: DUF4249 family protein [Ignavibacteriales bacterium]|nr:DUF4249 family protein [Ignavibacteriales bacterium]